MSTVASCSVVQCFFNQANECQAPAIHVRWGSVAKCDTFQQKPS